MTLTCKNFKIKKAMFVCRGWTCTGSNRRGIIGYMQAGSLTIITEKADPTEEELRIEVIIGTFFFDHSRSSVWALLSWRQTSQYRERERERGLR